MPQIARPTRTVALLAAFALGILPLRALATPHAAAQQPARIFRVGVIVQGGPSYYSLIDGLREGLKALGLEEGKHVVLDIRDTKGDLAAVEAAAKTLEQERIDLIFTGATSVTLAAKRATARVPMVFYAATDPVVVGLVESFAKPGGRLTGIYSQGTDLTGKRLQLLKEILPKLRRVVTFYDPKNRSAQESVKQAREAARQLKVEVIERRVASVEELQAGVRALRKGEADAYLFLADAMITSQAKLVIDTANAKGLATMATDPALVAIGALAAYGASFREAGRQAARHVQRILAGTRPQDLPVEAVDRVGLSLNLRTEKALGLTIPQSVLVRADELVR